MYIKLWYKLFVKHEIKICGGYFKIAVQSVETKGQLSTKPRLKFDPLDWIDSVDEQSETLQLQRWLHFGKSCSLTLQNLPSNIASVGQ